MTQEQKRIAISEACGWRDVRWTGPEPRTVFDELIGRPKHVSDEDSWCEVPDYFNNLNAMHEAEKVLITEAQNAKHDGFLLISLGFDKPIAFFEPDGRATSDFAAMTRAIRHATAAQRAEAFGLALGLWT